MKIKNHIKTQMQQAALIHDICGAAIHINVPVSSSHSRYPSISSCPANRKKYDPLEPIPEDYNSSTVFPLDSVIISLILTSEGNTYIDTHDKEGMLFMAKPDYNMKGIMSNDSILHAFLYTNKKGDNNLGLFDANKINGVDVSTNCPLGRHRVLFEDYHMNVKKQDLAPGNILHHGVGYEFAVLEVNKEKLHFETTQILRIPENYSDLCCNVLGITE